MFLYISAYVYFCIFLYISALFAHFCAFLYRYTHVHVLAENFNFAEPEEVSMPDSETTHKMLQNGGVDVSIGVR